MFIEYATLEQMLMRLFALSESQRGALTGRFKYIRGKALDQAPIGRGVARYELEDILRVVMVLELEDVGCSPAHAARIVNNHWSELELELSDAWDDVCARAAGQLPSGLVWAVMPHLLREMGSGPSVNERSLGEVAGTGPLPERAGWPERALGGDRHAVMINLPHLLAACCEAFATIAPDVERRFRQALDRMAREDRALSAQ